MTSSSDYASADAVLLQKLSEQLLDSICDADAVVIQDGSLACVCEVPAGTSPQTWTTSNNMPSKQRIYRYAGESGQVALAFEMPLRISSNINPFGRLLLRFTGENATDYARQISAAGHIIDCIARHFAIAGELSSIKQVSRQNEIDMQFLGNIDAQLASDDVRIAIMHCLDETRKHYGCTLVGLVVPDAGIKSYWPRGDQTSIFSGKTINRTLMRLYKHAKESRRVLVSNDPGLCRALETEIGRGTQVVCSPLANSKSEVSGILVLARADPFSRDDLRLARALCVKAAAYVRARNNVTSSAISRRSLIERIDTDIKHDPHRLRAFLFVDIDRLHIINDRFGHAAGDEVISSVERIIRNVASGRDLVGSLSGDLLGLYLEHADEARAREAAQKILDEIKVTPYSSGHSKISISASIGVAIMPDLASTGSQALSIAEVASKSAKSRGAGQYVVFKDQDSSLMQRHSDLTQIGGLQNALIEDRFVIYAQEIRSLKDDEPARKFELLTRMLDKNNQIVAPQKFLSAAERYQMMPALDRWVVSKSIEQLSSADNLLEINLSGFNINVSGQSIAETGFSDFVVDCVLQSGLSPDSLCFEITESTAVRHIDYALKFIEDIRSIGCRIALDDFGTGYCSFAYLQDLPVDFLKVDGMFVRNVCENPLSEAIVESVARLASVMNAATVAEYVENDLIANKLRSLGIDYAQGFGIGRPEPLADVLERMVSPIDLGLTGSLDLEVIVNQKALSNH
ncbi:MAG: EAL domain-containing protein [Pseudomonadota bacterium]